MVGTRPEAIKMAPVIFDLQSRSPAIDLKVVSTGQHKYLLDQALAAFGLTPDFNMEVMSKNQGLARITSTVLTEVDSLLNELRPDLVLVHGDTTTAFSVAMAAFYNRIPLGHVEAGLRTWNLNAPYPEELNRQFISKVATWHFAPTESAKRNLISERVNPQNILVTGNTAIDALRWVSAQFSQGIFSMPSFRRESGGGHLFDPVGSTFVLVTGHRRENFGEGFSNICRALARLATAHPDIFFVYPVHLNPNVREPVLSLLGGIPNILLLEPLTYPEFVYLLEHCYLVLTDSGGVQEEAPSFGKPVVVMRDATERPEAIQAGVAALVGSDTNKIFSEVDRLLKSKSGYDRMVAEKNPFGDGHAAARIGKFLEEEMTSNPT